MIKFDYCLSTIKDLKALIVFHRVDFDGVFSCCITEKFLDNLENCSEYSLCGYTYGDKFPDFKNYIENEGVNYIVILDVSFPKDTMLYLKEQYDLGKIGISWIDHHVTAIEDSIKNNYDDIPGFREIKCGACEYAWNYFFKDEICPDLIQYVSAFDIWDKNRFDWDNIVLPLQYSLREEFGVSEERIMDSLGNLLYIDEEDFNAFLEKGRNLLDYLKRTWKSAIKNFGFEITVAGKYRGIAIINTMFSSLIFGEKGTEYEVMCVVNRKGPDLYNCSLYIDPSTNIDFNAGNYLKENYGGGGHERAAGCCLNLEQFTRLIKDCSI